MRTRLLDLVLALIFVGAFFVSPARAEVAITDLEPIVGRAAWERLVRELPFDDDQHMIIDILFRDYATGLEDLAATITMREKAAGAERVREALHGRAVVDADELRRLRSEVAETRRAIFADAQLLMEELLAGVQSLGPTHRTVALRARELRRRAYLTPSRSAADRAHEAGARIDVGLLLDEAQTGTGEFAAGPPATAARIISEYHDQLDASLPAWCAADWNDAIDRELARISGNREQLYAVEQRQLERWRERFTLHSNAVRAIAEAASVDGDSDAATRWSERFQRECFPSLFAPARVDRALVWIRKSLEPDAVHRADGIADEYHAALRPLREEAVSLMLKARLEAGTIVHARSNPAEFENRLARELFEALLRNSGRRASLESRALDELRQGLDARELRRLDAASR